MKKRVSLLVMFVFYFIAGINHFRNPASYHKLIPPAIGHQEWINIAAGIAEIVSAVLLLFNPTRKWACYGIIIMLIAFIPSHIYMAQTGFCPEINGEIYCAPQWLLWVRLFLLQPLLLWWAWQNRNASFGAS